MFIKVIKIFKNIGQSTSDLKKAHVWNFWGSGIMVHCADRICPRFFSLELRTIDGLIQRAHKYVKFELAVLQLQLGSAAEVQFSPVLQPFSLNLEPWTKCQRTGSNS